jgi:DNA-binding NarL/FixJ family response regulator
MIRVVVVDDHPLLRDSLTDLLEATGGITVVGQCADGSQVTAVVAEARPDVLLLDLQMPRVDGLTAAHAVRAAHAEVRIVFLTGGLTAPSVREAHTMGAAGYLLKDDDPDELPAHIRTVAAGGTAWHARATALLDNAHEAECQPSPTTTRLQQHGGIPSNRSHSAGLA